MLKKESFSWKIIFVIVWLSLTLSMAGWWMYFSLQLLQQHSQSADADLIQRQRNMLMWEGAAWMILLLLGGLTLAYFVVRERWQARQIREFVAAFTHDLKTSLASLRLQTESLMEDLKGKPERPLVERLAADTVRLQLQLENSLYLASDNDFQPILQDLSLRQLVENIADQWPLLNLRMTKEAWLIADEKAMTSVLTNVIQNSVVHGGAENVNINVCTDTQGRVRVEISDDGSGFDGDYQQLGQIFYRHNPSSGSGVGLFIVRHLVQKMNGSLEFTSSKVKKGFKVDLVLQGRLT